MKHKCTNPFMCINRQGFLSNMLLLAQPLILCLIILQAHTPSRGCAQGLVSEHAIRAHLLAFCPVLRVPIGSAGHVKQTADGSRTEVSQVRPAVIGRVALHPLSIHASGKLEELQISEFNTVSSRTGCKIGPETLKSKPQETKYYVLFFVLFYYFLFYFISKDSQFCKI